jgi:curli production assembly/transport component CsgF
MKKIIISVLASIGASTASAQLVHQFNSPAFSGQGYSSHVLTIDQLEATRKKTITDAEKSAQEKIARDAKNTNLAKFLVNVESRIYAQLSKQLADAMFAEGGATDGTMDFQGTTISWVKSGSDVTLTITEASGNRTDITVPLASFSF